LFQGEEWGASTPFLYFTDHQDPELGRLVAEGRSKEFSAFAWAGEVPNPQAPDTFARSKLDWSELTHPQHAELLEWYRRLIALRRSQSEHFGNARPSVKCHAASKWLKFTAGGILAVFNFAAHAQRVPLPAGDWELILSSDAQDLDATAPVPANGTRIFSCVSIPRRVAPTTRPSGRVERRERGG
jgi:maltooligosyltrehalose trehalohydrolase